jgi:phosphonate utilization associated putative membrane protein
VTWPLVLVVLCAALLHAGWNVLVKSSGDKTLDTALLQLLAGLLMLPVALALGLPPPASWPYLLASGAVHLAYLTTLARAYQHGDLAVTYPIMRGLAPLLVALGSGTLIGETPSAAAWAGTGAITLGVALVGLAHPGDALNHRKALAFALANAVIIAGYTVLDGLGTRAAGSALHYVAWLFVLSGGGFAVIVTVRRRALQRPGLLAYARGRWPRSALGAAASVASYALALWAMGRAPVASIAALRETSVLFAAVLGTVLLKERLGLQRSAGAAVIVAGVMALRFS